MIVQTVLLHNKPKESLKLQIMGEDRADTTLKEMEMVLLLRKLL